MRVGSGDCDALSAGEREREVRRDDERRGEAGTCRTRSESMGDTLLATFKVPAEDGWVSALGEGEAADISKKSCCWPTPLLVDRGELNPAEEDDSFRGVSWHANNSDAAGSLAGVEGRLFTDVPGLPAFPTGLGEHFFCRVGADEVRAT